MSQQSSLTYANVTSAVLSMVERPSQKWWAIFVVDLAVLAFGMYCFYHQVTTGIGVAGYSHPVFWGVYITNFVFWVGIAHSGTLISAILYLFRARFRMSIYRVAEAMTVFAVATAGLFPIIHLGRPWNFYWLFPYPNQREIWINFKSPLVWDVFAVGTYATVSTLFFIVGMIPDIAAIRDRVPETPRKIFYKIMSFGWKGSAWEWKHYTRAYFYFAAFATPLVISVHSVVSWDFAMANTPGWHTTIFPPYFVAGAIFSGLAMVITLIVPLRKVFKLEEFITLDNFEGMAKLIMLTSAIVTYAYAAEFFVAWYSGNQFEFDQFIYRATGDYAVFYWIMVTCNCAIPLLLWARRVRRSVNALFIIAIFINIGMWFERFNIIVISLSQEFEPAAFGVYRPTWVELGITAGSFAWFLMFFLVFIKLMPALSIAEVKEVMPPPMKKEAGV